jgi:hypothetical protein
VALAPEQERRDSRVHASGEADDDSHGFDSMLPEMRRAGPCGPALPTHARAGLLLRRVGSLRGRGGSGGLRRVGLRGLRCLRGVGGLGGRRRP